MSDLHLEAVGKSFDGRSYVVRDLSMTIRQGEFLTLLGPSGSGKTTTLMMIAGFETPSEGRILHGGAPLDAVPTHRRNFGFVFQNYALFPHMSVQENILFPLKMRGLGRAEALEKAERALDMVRLRHCRDRRPDRLSGGQQQRIALARALVFDPQVVLLDEPLGALDKSLREEMQLELKELHGRLGVSFVFVTHDQEEALTMSDRIAVFDGGRLQQIGSPAEVYNDPETPFVAEFVGDINKLACSVAGDTGAGFREVAVAAGYNLRVPRQRVRSSAGAATLYVRPERVRELAGGGGERLKARVLDVVYKGAYASLAVETEEGQRLSLVELARGGEPQSRSGALLELTIDAESCLVF